MMERESGKRVGVGAGVERGGGVGNETRKGLRNIEPELLSFVRTKKRPGADLINSCKLVEKFAYIFTVFNYF